MTIQENKNQEEASGDFQLARFSPKRVENDSREATEDESHPLSIKRQAVKECSEKKTPHSASLSPKTFARILQASESDSLNPASKVEHSKSARLSRHVSRPMGHYPPRPSDNPQPPVDCADTSGASPLHDSWSEISNQFEENVGKPSRDALHKFFYPPANKDLNHSQRNLQKHQHRTSKAYLHDNENNTRMTEKDSREQPTGLCTQDTACLENGIQSLPESTTLGSAVESPTDEERQSEGQEERPSQQCSSSSSVVQRIVEVAAGTSSLECQAPTPGSLTPGLDNMQTASTTIQRSFDAQEEDDRKWVEHVWTIYDDIIILSLFTQLGVVARLAASTWFTFFDGVFRADSPLFTNLPLNCLSCFLLGLLGSGERLMEQITTRFTPRNLQQRILDNNDDNENSDNNENLDSPASRGALRRRGKRNRRPLRSKSDDEYFHSWQPPLHWHDDLREVQLLALERRIRASKCLVLFPVMKEDADVMEHYFGGGYKASAQQNRQQKQLQSQQPGSLNRRHTGRRRRRGRRRFGRKKYGAASLVNDDDDTIFLQGCGSDNIHEEEHLEEIYDDDESPEASDFEENSEAYDVTEPDDDGRFRFDLRLTESTEDTKLDIRNEATRLDSPEGIATTSNLESPASVPPSIQKLIKRAPGISPRASSVNEGFVTNAGAGFSPTFGVESSKARGCTESASHTSFRESFPLQQQEQHQTQHHSSLNGGIPASSALSPAGLPRSTSGSESDQRSLGTATSSAGGEVDPQLEQIISNVQVNMSENISRMRRVNLADGWDVGTTPDAMSDDLMLGLRDGFCGALSSFSSWNSSMLNLLREGHIGEAFVGYMLGLQLPIVAYRFGQQVAVYYFVWRCRREARREERKGGYGIRVSMDDIDGDIQSSDDNLSTNGNSESFEDEFIGANKSAETSLAGDDVLSQETPSMRAIFTAFYLLALVTQFTSLSFFSDPEDHLIALSLLFSPFGTIARWRLSRLNNWRPGFPLGTFACNIFACALSGSLGGLLAGNPGPRERILLQSFIAGFGGTLSSLATFIMEILAGIDPLLFRFDGVIYAVCSVMWALIVGFVFSASVDWADEVSA